MRLQISDDIKSGIAVEKQVAHTTPLASTTRVCVL